MINLAEQELLYNCIIQFVSRWNIMSGCVLWSETRSAAQKFLGLKVIFIQAIAMSNSDDPCVPAAVICRWLWLINDLLGGADILCYSQIHNSFYSYQTRRKFCIMRQRKRKFSSENIINFTPIVLTEYQSGSEEKIWIKNLFNQFIELA